MESYQQKIILVEGKQTDHPSFFFSLKKKGYNVEIAKNGVNALEKIKENVPALILIDAASLRISGKRIIYGIKKRYPYLPVVVVVDDTFTEKDIPARADQILTLPFSIQKLVNKISIYLKDDPEKRKTVGDISLDTEANILYVRDRQPQSLTPRVSKILNLMMENPGKVIKRSEIFCKVWDTNYIEDMRSLDVHIRWLRKIMEDKPKKPKYLITVRGVGYKLNPYGVENLPEKKAETVIGDLDSDQAL